MHRQGFSLDEGNAAAVAAVCARLDGIPLALELAAARLGSLSVPEISSRLDQRLRLLTGGSRTALPRHQTLRALIDWSYELLNPEERLVLDRLSVFAGGWALEAAEAVTSRGDTAEWQVLDHLAALVDKSLVQADETRGSTRYRLLETVRHYAAERLALRPGAELDKPAPPTAITTWLWSRPPTRTCAARTRPPGSTGSRPSSTTSAPRWRSASPTQAVPSPACGWPPGCAGSATCAATPAKSSRRSTPCSSDPTPACPPGPGPGPHRELPPAQSLR